mgnify:CR=1 FL=1
MPRKKILSDGTPLTLPQYDKLPREVHGEVVRGRLLREPPHRTVHGLLVARVSALLSHFVDERRLGVVLSESGYITAQDPPTVRGPDVSFIAAERVADGLPADGYWEGVPDLAVEILSAEDRPGATADKVLEYLGGGAQAVWIVQPRTRALVVHLQGARIHALQEEDVLDGAPVLPGFHLPLTRLFQDVPRY